MMDDAELIAHTLSKFVADAPDEAQHLPAIQFIVNRAHLMADAAVEALTRAPAAEPVLARQGLVAYDAGLLNDYGGGNVDWWWDYIRSELERAHEHYAAQFEGLDQRSCTCHPDDMPEGLCPRRYSASECHAAAMERAGPSETDPPRVRNMTHPNPRRPLDDDFPEGYLESDADFVLNNLEWCVAQLMDALDRARALAALTRPPETGEDVVERVARAIDRELPDEVRPYNRERVARASLAAAASGEVAK